MIKRLIFNKLEHEISEPEINILLGARQVGKTTLLKNLARHVDAKGESYSFFDLEQPEVLAQFNLSDKDVTEKLKAAGKFVFIDEFQYLKNASKIFKALFDLNVGIKIFCSGSSSLEIHKHLKESLAGRRFLFRIFPLQYAELKKHFGDYPLELYLRYGGMPALSKTESETRKGQILSELLSAYILKDVKSLVPEENIRAFNHLLYLLAENQGSPVSIHSLGNEISMSSKTVGRYLDIMEQTFVNYRIHSFSSNLGNELKKSCKTYLYDLGIRNALLKDFSASVSRKDKGVLLESFVFLKLQTLLQPNMELRFWRTKDGDEVDFILLKNRQPYPLEVKSFLKSREIPKGLRRFLLRYPKTRQAFVVNENQSGRTVEHSCQIRYLTVEEFEDAFPEILNDL